ncbi:MAG TPA: hypothetical protein VGY76_11985 [Solirubrobacteraceae bacterium]|nr:hypothetical protein [Solirubrobacteraceae bacterium]
MHAPVPEGLTFFLGTHEVGWLERGIGPLFVSHRRLKRRARLPRAAAPWALDSGGFTELRLHGGWQTSVDEYLEATRRYTQEIGGLQFAFSMDWMCEPAILRRTGLTIQEHQRRTVANFAELRGRAPDLPFAPVLQGWRLADYARCADLYHAWGFDLTREPRVGVGSICTRQGTPEVENILYSLAAGGLALHAFGVKHRGLPACAGALASADSTSWSLQARFDTPLPCCRHQRCSNCIKYAVRWRDRLLSQLDTDLPDARFRRGWHPHSSRPRAC